MRKTSDTEIESGSHREPIHRTEAERQRYRRFFERAPIAWIICDRAGEITEANQAARALLESPLVGAPLASFVAGPDVEGYLDHLEAAFASDVTESMELFIETRRGQTIPVQLETVALSIDTAQIALVDLGERRVLPDSETRYLETLDTIPVGVLLIDRDWRVLGWNRAAAAVFGRPVPRSLGRPIDEVFPGIPDHPAFALCDEALSTGEPRVTTVEYDRPDGPGVYELDILPVDEGGVAVIAIDITARRRAEAAVEVERLRNHAILASAPDAIITVDQRGVVESFNPAAAVMFGYGPSEILGERFDRLLARPHGELYRRFLEGFVRTGVASIGDSGRELEARRADGSTFPIHLSVTEIPVGGQRSFCGFVRDLTESKRLESELRRSHKLEAVGTLASGIAHDFNNLLMGVGGCASVALNNLDAEHPARMYLEEIRKSTRSGAAIIKQLLAFTRKAELVPTVFELETLIDRNRAMLERLLGEDIELDIRLADPGNRIRADVGQIEQVLMNLAINARDAMPGGGRLTIETARLTGTEQVLLRVVDTGEGMSLETRERVFDPFYSTKAADRGTGLGLSTVYGIVKQTGGRISVDSEPGRGTTFEIRLPLEAEQVTAETEPVDVSDRPATPRDQTVLVCEDDRLVRLGLRHFLENAGFRVLDAATGPEAIECFERYHDRIDLVLTDIILPGSSGARVSEAVRRVRPSVPILYMSAHSPEWLVSHGRIAAGAMTLQKPFENRDLLDRIDALLGASGDTRARRSPGRVLLVEDNEAAREAVTEYLGDLGWEVASAGSAERARELARASEHGYDVLLIDYSLPRVTGDVLARELRAQFPEIEIVYMSGFEAPDLDPPGLFLEKPLDLEEIAHVLDDLIPSGGSSR